MFSQHRLGDLLRRAHTEHRRRLGDVRGGQAIVEAAKEQLYIEREANSLANALGAADPPRCM